MIKLSKLLSRSRKAERVATAKLLRCTEEDLNLHIKRNHFIAVVGGNYVICTSEGRQVSQGKSAKLGKWNLSAPEQANSIPQPIKHYGPKEQTNG